MKKVQIFIISLLTIISLSAQNNLGTIFYNVKDYELAKKYFQQKLSENPGEANYYLGEIAFAEGDLTTAAEHFNKGMQTNEAYCRIGLAKIDLKNGKKSEALTIFLSVQKKFSGDIDILAAIGYAYLDNKLHQEVQSVLKDMMKITNKNPKIYVLEGDMLKAEDKIGEAAGKYEMALYFDPKFDLARIKLVEIYERSNWQIAVEKLNDLLEQNPNYILAYRYLGRIYTVNGYWLKAIDAYKTFFAAGNYTLDDIGRFTQALFFNKNYDDAYEKIKEGLAIDPNNFVLNRLRMYVATHTLNIEAGLEYAKQFFLLKGDNIALDFSMYAQLLKEAKMYDEAIEQYKKALVLDPSTVDMYNEMAAISNLKGQNGVAADYMKLFIEKKGANKVLASDFFSMGRYYYIACNARNANDTALIINRMQDVDFINTIAENEEQKDSLLTDKYFFIEKTLKYYMNQADIAFDVFIERNAASYQGYLWKARTNALLDPETELGLAKPHYEKVIELLAEREDKNQTMITSLIEAYRYLAYFYYKKEDSPNARLNCEKLLELDPEEPTANQLIKILKK